MTQIAPRTTVLSLPEPVAEQSTRSAACAMAATAESVPAMRRFACMIARCWKLPDGLDQALALIVTELSTNVVRHSGSADLALLLTVDKTTITVQVKDSGRWRHRPASSRPRAHEEACNGRGLPLVEAYAASLRVWPSAFGTHVVAELPLPALPA